MSVSAISNSSAYTSLSGTSTSEISQLKAEEKRLEEQLEKLEKSSSGGNSQATQTEERSLEQRISRIEQQIQQAKGDSASSTIQTASATQSRENIEQSGSTTNLLDTKA